jgi:hypothetical protein
MGGNLMSTGNHTFDHIRPGRSWIIDLAFTDVVASNKERGFRIVGSIEIQKLVGVNVRAIVISDDNRTRYNA